MMKLDDDYLTLTASLTQQVKTDSYLQLQLQPGSRHLEIGCGNGVDSLALARQYPQSHITGVDLDEDIVQVARERSEKSNLNNVTHVSGNAITMTFSDKFNSIRAERVFQHLDDSQIYALIANLAGYTEPGCIFSIVGIDWETLTCTVGKQHLDTFHRIKDFLINVSNMTFVHTAMDALEQYGFDSVEVETYSITTRKFDIAMAAFNLKEIASQAEIGNDDFESMKSDFHQDRDYFSVSGCTACFKAG